MANVTKDKLKECSFQFYEALQLLANDEAAKTQPGFQFNNQERLYCKG